MKTLKLQILTKIITIRFLKWSDIYFLDFKLFEINIIVNIAVIIYFQKHGQITVYYSNILALKWFYYNLI